MMSDPLVAALNQVFERNLEYLARWDTTLANHVSMAAAAMFLMRDRCEVRPDKLLEDAARGSSDLVRRRTNASGIAIGQVPWAVQRQLLGFDELWESWEAFFVEEFNRDGVDETVRRWIERLGFGLCGAAGHSIIRMHYALAVRDVLPAQTLCRELAIAFADLASRYTVLTENNIVAGEASLEAYLGNHAPTPTSVIDLMSTGTLIEDRFLLLRTTAEFQETAADIGLGYDVLACLRQLASLVGDDLNITLLHAVTVGEAVHGLCGKLSDFDERPLKQGYRDFVVATVISGNLANAAADRRVGGSAEDILVRVPALMNDHAQKSTCSLVQLHEKTGDGVFIEAARRFQNALG